MIPHLALKQNILEFNHTVCVETYNVGEGEKQLSKNEHKS